MTQIRWVILVLLGWLKMLVRARKAIAQWQVNDYSGFRRRVNAIRWNGVIKIH
jgi:hypothetical protein